MVKVESEIGYTIMAVPYYLVPYYLLLENKLDEERRLTGVVKTAVYRVYDRAGTKGWDHGIGKVSIDAMVVSRLYSYLQSLQEIRIQGAAFAGAGMWKSS